MLGEGGDGDVDAGDRQLGQRPHPVPDVGAHRLGHGADRGRVAHREPHLERHDLAGDPRGHAGRAVAVLAAGRHAEHAAGGAADVLDLAGGGDRDLLDHDVGDRQAATVGGVLGGGVAPDGSGAAC